MIRVTSITPAIHGLTFHDIILRQNEQVDEKQKSKADAVLNAEVRRKSGARRTAWIVGALALAFFIASLVEGHLSHIPH